MPGNSRISSEITLMGDRMDLGHLDTDGLFASKILAV